METLHTDSDQIKEIFKQAIIDRDADKKVRLIK